MKFYKIIIVIFLALTLAACAQLDEWLGLHHESTPPKTTSVQIHHDADTDSTQSQPYENTTTIPQANNTAVKKEKKEDENPYPADYYHIPNVVKDNTSH